VAKTGSIHSTNSSTVQWPRSSIRRTRIPEDNSRNKGNVGSLRKATIRNVNSDNPSPNLRKTLLAIAIPPAPVIQNRASPMSPEEAARSTYHQRHGFEWMSTKAKRQTCTALAVAAETTKPTFVPNTARQTHLDRTPAIAAAMTANKLNDQNHSTCNSKKTILPLSISNSMGEAGRYGVRIGKLKKLSLNCNLGRDTTAPNRPKIKSHSGGSGSYVKPIHMRHRETGFCANHP